MSTDPLAALDFPTTAPACETPARHCTNPVYARVVMTCGCVLLLCAQHTAQTFAITTAAGMSFVCHIHGVYSVTIAESREVQI